MKTSYLKTGRRTFLKSIFVEQRIFVIDAENIYEKGDWQ